MDQIAVTQNTTDSRWHTGPVKDSPRWTYLAAHQTQVNAWQSLKRFNVVPAGRRSGKTEIIGKRKMALRFMTCHMRTINGRINRFYSPYPNPRFFIAAPTRDQVKRIYWSDIKALIPRRFVRGNPSESNLMIPGVNGAELWLMGLDKPERIEGSPWDWGVVDEIANVKPTAWQENIRPALSDRGGGCDFIGVPEGRGHYYDLFTHAQQEMMDPDGEWGAFHWTAEEILPLYGKAHEIVSAKKYLDELVYQQEYLASFINFTGMAYYNFNRNIHVGRYAQFYNPKKPIFLCFDFNVAPGVCAIGQEMGADVFQVPIGETVTAWIGEVFIPQQSNTPMVCRKIIEQWGNHEGLVLCYGDATGGAEGTAKIKGSDWDLIKEILFKKYGPKLFINVPKSNPRERQRVNSMNSRMVSASGDVRMVVDGDKAPWIVKDLEGTRVVEGSAGEIDKKTDPELTHLTDSMGYYVHKEFPIQRYISKKDLDEWEKEQESKGRAA